MTVGEVVGLAVVALLLGASAGVGVGMLLMARLMRSRHGERSSSDAYAKWLAARFTHSRASVSFVAAFRALASEAGDAPNLQLRIEEAQRARADWIESVRLLDRADSLVIASTLDPALPGRLRAFRPVGVGELRAAIDGPMIVVDRFRRTLREADEAAIDFMLSELSNGSWHSGMRQVVSAGVLRGASRVGGLIDRWSSAP